MLPGAIARRVMRLVIFGLTVSSSWGNGHATLWRGMLKALAARGHKATFYEKDVPYYASTRDGWSVPDGIAVRLYADLNEIAREAARACDGADVVIITSYCPDGRRLSQLAVDSRAALKVFYDLDTPVTLNALSTGANVSYLPSHGLSDFDVVLSYTGGRALAELQTRLGARWVQPLYGWVDPDLHRLAAAMPEFASDLSYLGTYAEDRQRTLEELFLKTARANPDRRFAIGGAQYPEHFPWVENIFFVRHLPPALHPAFFSSSRVTLNVTRQAMAAYGFCPSGRLFEAAACGTPLVTDTWNGLDDFFSFGTEILPANTSADVQAVLQLTDEELQRIAASARERTLAEHTAAARAITLESILEQAVRGDACSVEEVSAAEV